MGLPGGTNGKEPTCWCRRHEAQVWSLGWEDPLEKSVATHSSILPQRIQWTEEHGGHRVRHNWSDLGHIYSYTCGPICSLTHIHDWASFTFTEFRCPLQSTIQWSFTKSNYTTCNMSIYTGRSQVKKSVSAVKKYPWTLSTLKGFLSTQMLCFPFCPNPLLVIHCYVTN